MKIIINNLKKDKKDKIIGIIYGKNLRNILIEFKNKEKYYKYLVLEKFIELKIINTSYNTLIKEIKKHPYKKKITHISFLKNE